MARAVGTAEKEKPLSYRYEAFGRQGKVVKGTVKARNEFAAERLVIEQGYDPIQVELVPSMFSLEEAFPTFYKVKEQDIVIFSRQLATLLRSGISLLPALEIIHGQALAGRAFKRILGTIINDIRAGNSFSDAISKHSRAFSDIYCRTITVGEQTGNLETVLNSMAVYIEKKAEATGRIKKAMTYPAIMLVVALGVVVLLVTMVMPNLMGMFTAMNVELPLPTRMLMGVTDFVSTNTLYLVIGVVLLGVVVLWFAKQPTGRRLLDRLRLHAPLIGPPTLMGELARFCRTMSVMVGSGMKLHEIMQMVPQSSTNRYMQDALKKVHEGLLLGEGLSEPMHRQNIFPALLIQMVAVGEESNTLDFTMGVVADFYETASEQKVNTMVSMLGPLSTVIIALMVGFIAMAVILPIYSLTGAF